jgi:hypothetical protein
MVDRIGFQCRDPSKSDERTSTGARSVRFGSSGRERKILTLKARMTNRRWLTML